jgi:glutamate 5-kinase
MGEYGMNDYSIAPRRRIECQLHLSADSWLEAASALAGVALRLYEARERGDDVIDVTSGGVASGYTLTATEDPDITHDSYIAKIQEYLTAKKAESTTQKESLNA